MRAPPERADGEETAADVRVPPDEPDAAAATASTPVAIAVT
jgi:hypothetical protein